MDEAQLNRSKKAAKALKSRVELIERHLKPLLQKDLLDTYNTLPINEKCQMDVLLSYAINTLYYSKLIPPSHRLMAIAC
jgi:exosome complex protein LRP1